MPNCIKTLNKRNLEGTVAAGPEWTTEPIRNAMVIAGTATDPADPAVRMEHDSPEAAATAAADMTATITAVVAETAAGGGRGPNGPSIPIKDPGFSTRYRADLHPSFFFHSLNDCLQSLLGSGIQYSFKSLISSKK